MGSTGRAKTDMFISPEVKAQVSYSDYICDLSVDCLSVNFSHFQYLLKNHWAIQPNLAESILRLRGFKVVKIKEHFLLQGEIIRSY